MKPIIVIYERKEHWHFWCQQVTDACPSLNLFYPISTRDDYHRLQGIEASGVICLGNVSNEMFEFAKTRVK